MEELKPLNDFYLDPEQLDEEYCSRVNCQACEGTDQNGEPNGYGCSSRDNWVEKHLELVHDDPSEIMSHLESLQSKFDKAEEALEEVKGIHTDSGSVACRLKNIALKALSTLRGKEEA